MTPVRSQWWPMTIGPDACAKTSLVRVRLAAPPASAVSRKPRREIFRLVMSLLLFRMGGSLLRYSEIAMDDFGLRLEVVCRPRMDDGALLHQKHARAQFERGLDVLLDQQDGDAGLVDAMDLAPDLRDEARHDAL